MTFTASSERTGYAAAHAYDVNDPSNSEQEYWSPAISDTSQWLQVDLNGAYSIKAFHVDAPFESETLGFIREFVVQYRVDDDDGDWQYLRHRYNST